MTKYILCRKHIRKHGPKRGTGRISYYEGHSDPDAPIGMIFLGDDKKRAKKMPWKKAITIRDSIRPILGDFELEEVI